MVAKEVFSHVTRKEYLNLVGLRVVEDGTKILDLISGKIEAMQKYITESGVQEFESKGLTDLVSGAQQYVDMLKEVGTALNNDLYNFASRMRALVSAKGEEKENLIKEALSLLFNIDDSCKTARKNIGISFSRYEFAFERHKMLTKCFVEKQSVKAAAK